MQTTFPINAVLSKSMGLLLALVVCWPGAVRADVANHAEEITSISANTARRGKPDLFANFSELSASKRAGIDYLITVIDREAPLTVLAIHGGMIEPQSSELARDIAGEQANLYLFEGLKPHIRDLHITSTHFDEPQALELVRHSNVCVSVHGYLEDRLSQVCLGGRNEEFVATVAEAIKALEIPVLVETPCAKFPAREPSNIVNRCINQGVQLELSSKLASDLKARPQLRRALARAINNGFSALK